MICWLVGHKWLNGFDPHFQTCSRCDKVRSKKFPGTIECAYCSRPINKPPSLVYSNIYDIETQCVHCGKKTRWSRDNTYSNWKNPTLIIDFKME